MNISHEKTITYKSRWLQQFYLSGRAHNSGSRGHGFKSCWLPDIFPFFSISLQCVLGLSQMKSVVSWLVWTKLMDTIELYLCLKQVSLIQTVIIYGPVNFIRLTPSEWKLTKNSWLDVSLDFRLEEDLAETQSRRAPWPFWFKLGGFFLLHSLLIVWTKVNWVRLGAPEKVNKRRLHGADDITTQHV